MTRKTYAARGLLDWQMALNIGGAVLKIRFAGGAMGSNGVVPAKYSTDNEAIQKMIENTRHFKCGKIFIYSVDTKESDSKE